MKKKNSNILFLFLIVGLFLVLANQNNMFPFSQVLSDTFVNPDWARLECAPTDSYESSFSATLEQQNLFKCDGFTQECRFMVECTRSSYLSCKINYAVCDLSGANCGGSQSIVVNGRSSQDIPMINVGESYKIEDDAFTPDERVRVTQEYKPWKLYRFVGGAKWIVNSANCDITSSTKAKIRDVDYPGSKLYRIGGEGQKWTNYINSWNYGIPSNVFTYQGKEVYCNSAKIYEIVELEMADGSIKKLEPTYNEELPNGDSISGQGSLISSVECCPNEPNCNDDFEYEQTQTSCFTDAQCINAGGPIPTDGTHYVFEKCINEKCVLQNPVTVECTNTAICVTKYGSGHVCDLSTTNYGQCIEQIIGEYCGDGKCNSLLGETEMTCCVDCGGCVNPSKKCKNCDAFALSSILVSVFGEDASASKNKFVRENVCSPELLTIPPQTNTTCAFSFIKLFLVPITLIFGFLILSRIFMKFRELRKNKTLRIVLSLGISVLLAWIVFKIFFLGVIAFVVIVIWEYSIGGSLSMVSKTYKKFKK